MNKRIQELAEQAEAHYRDNVLGASMYKTPPIKLMEQFAELIVKECMKLNRDILCEDDPDYLDQVYKEHFGVEE